MSDKVLLNSSFNNNPKKSVEIYILEDMLVINKYNKEDKIDINSITKIILLNTRCPKTSKRLISYLMVLIASILFVLGLFFKDNNIIMAILFILAAIVFVLAGVITKKIYSVSPSAIGMTIYKNGKKCEDIVGVSTTSKDYSILQRIARTLKKENNDIILDFESRK